MYKYKIHTHVGLKTHRNLLIKKCNLQKTERRRNNTMASRSVQSWVIPRCGPQVTGVARKSSLKVGWIIVQTFQRPLHCFPSCCYCLQRGCNQHCHWSIFNINQTNPKAIFLVRLRYPNRKLTRKLFHNAFTLWLLHNRQDQTLWLFFVAVPLAIPQCIHSQSCTEDGNENPVLHTIPQQPQTSTLSSGPLHKREDDERVWLSWSN